MRCIVAAAIFCMCANAQAALTKPLAEARASLINIVEWKFQPDPGAIGEQQGWKDAEFDDTQWPVVRANAAWQEQGFPNHHGVAWYRFTFKAPRTWRGSRVLLQSDGVQDEYDLYVNGSFVRHFGSAELGVNYNPTQAEIEGFLNTGGKNVLAVRVLEHGTADGGGISHRIVLRRVPDFENYRRRLPSPVLDSHPELIDLYWKTWKMAWEKISFGTPENGFVPAYMEEGYSDQIFQWDTIFISRYGVYGRRLFPAMAGLDNFYSKQEPDGYIQRIYSKTNGEKLIQPSEETSMTNPPLFAWAELEYYELTGDTRRLRRVVPVLEKYDQWLDSHLASPNVPGLYKQVAFESGMDNMPRPNAGNGGWIDQSAQMALAARDLARLNHVLGRFDRERHWLDVFRRRRDAINHWSWSARDGIYYDLDNGRNPTGVKHIGAFWTMLSGVAPSDRAAKLVEHLENPDEFHRRHLFPALSASDPSYAPQASYWAGGVWAPTDYMVIRGLEKYGFTDFAHEAALNHLSNLAAVYASRIDFSHVDPNEAIDDAHTIWECYNPDRPVPCTRADAYYYGRQNFAGWTGIGPVALLIEQAIGLKLQGAANRIVWTLREPGQVGLKDFELENGNKVSLVAGPSDGASRRLSVSATRPFKLEIRIGERVQRLAVPAGRRVFKLRTSPTAP